MAASTSFSTTLANTSLGLSAAGAASQVVGSYFQAKTNKSQLNAEANIAEQNARIAELGAQGALKRGEREQQISRLRTAQLKGSQIASMAANGIDLSSATAQEILNTTDIFGEIDANTIEANAIQSAWGYRTEATNLVSQATMNRANASGINPLFNAGTNLLGTGATVAKQWYTLGKEGAVD